LKFVQEDGEEESSYYKRYTALATELRDSKSIATLDECINLKYLDNISDAQAIKIFNSCCSERPATSYEILYCSMRKNHSTIQVTARRSSQESSRAIWLSDDGFQERRWETFKYSKGPFNWFQR
jgi:hypothetical protein